MMFRSILAFILLSTNASAFSPMATPGPHFSAPLMAKKGKSAPEPEEPFFAEEPTKKVFSTPETSALLNELSSKAQDLGEKAKEFASDDRVKDIAAKAGDFAKDVADQIFGKVGAKLKEIKKEKELQEAVPRGEKKKLQDETPYDL